MSDPVQPHRQQPTGLPRPWDSPGKNSGVGCHFLLQCMKVKSESEVTRTCPTLCDPMDCSLPGSSVHGIFQARVLEWGCHCLLQLVCQSCPALWDPMGCGLPGSSMGLSRKEYWSELQFPSPGDLPHPGIEPDFLYQRQILYCLSHQGSPTLHGIGKLMTSSTKDWENLPMAQSIFSAVPSL